ncbi:hypothetical protein OUZ56_023205 [Daphnia magna]|uniref:Uncharacterized protein n=1 Tax=Daphnia magna TaxID=35525 RepID=A0ABR0AYR4_9CRUS|nr:hypothetical protein OUZ56_023205 [Daphnia magna]
MKRGARDGQAIQRNSGAGYREEEGAQRADANGEKEKNVLPGAAPALRESGLERPARRYVTTNQSALHQCCNPNIAPLQYSNRRD